MFSRNEPAEEAQAPAVCDACRTIPISHLALDVLTPLVGWEAYFSQRGVEVVVDDVGRRAVAREVLGEMIAERAAAEAERVAESERRREAAKPKARPARGVPVPKGTGPNVSAVALMIGADRDSEYRRGLPPDRGEFTQPRRKTTK